MARQLLALQAEASAQLAGALPALFKVVPREAPWAERAQGLHQPAEAVAAPGQA